MTTPATTSNLRSTMKELGWVAFFFLVLAALTFPAILLSRRGSFELSVFHQAAIVAATTWICQRARGGSITGVVGKLDSAAVRDVIAGIAAGAALMLLPAALLSSGRWVRWEAQPMSAQALWWAVASATAGAITEELLFRGFVFRRLLALGVWPAQILISAYFLLTHLGNPGMSQEVKTLAMANIFLASIVFGLTVIRTGSLMMAVAMHAAANLVQGPLLGFGVSGHAQQSLFRPTIGTSPSWLTGGDFGLEGSLPGLLAVLTLVVVFERWRPRILRRGDPAT